MAKQNREIMNLFIGTIKLHKREIEKAALLLGINRSQHSLLMYLFRSDVQPTQKQIAEHFNISGAAVTKIIKKSESSGYITRKADEGDTRYNRIFITQKGEQIISKTKELFDSVDERMLGSLSEEEKETFCTILQKLQASIC